MSAGTVTTPYNRNNVIICGRGMRGKTLANAIIRQLRKDSIAHVAALSDVGIEHIVKVGQTVANAMGTKVNADPERTEIEISPGTYRAALVMTLRMGDVPPANEMTLDVAAEIGPISDAAYAAETFEEIGEVIVNDEV